MKGKKEKKKILYLKRNGSTMLCVFVSCGKPKEKCVPEKMRRKCTRVQRNIYFLFEQILDKQERRFSSIPKKTKKQMLIAARLKKNPCLVLFSEILRTFKYPALLLINLFILLTKNDKKEKKKKEGTCGNFLCVLSGFFIRAGGRT